MSASDEIAKGILEAIELISQFDEDKIPYAVYGGYYAISVFNTFEENDKRNFKVTRSEELGMMHFSGLPVYTDNELPTNRLEVRNKRGDVLKGIDL